MANKRIMRILTVALIIVAALSIAVAAEGFTVNGNTVEGLNDSVVYEYAKADYFGTSAWTEITGATEITDLDNALWAIRVKGTDDISYALVGNDTAKQSTVINIDESGKKTLVIDKTKAFSKGAWSSTTYFKYIAAYNSGSKYGGVLNNGFASLPSDNTTAFNKLRLVDVTYVMDDEQIIPVNKLGSMEIGFSFNGYIASRLFENYPIRSHTYTIRLHTVGTDKPYYDVKGNWDGVGDKVANVQYFDIDDDAYVTAIQVFFVTDIPADANIQDANDLNGTKWTGRDLYPIFYLYSYNLRAEADAPVLALGENTLGSAITGLDANKLYAYSTDNKTWTTLPEGSASFNVTEAGTYYVKSLTYKNFFESAVAEITVDGIQAKADVTSDGNAIVGLLDTVTYQYATVDYFGKTEWVDVAGATEIADLADGLYAVRVKADGNTLAGPITYVLVGVDSAEQASVLKIDAAGVKSVDVNGASSFNKGYWSSVNYRNIAVFASKTTYAAVLNNSFSNLNADDTAGVNQLAQVDVTYVMKDNQIIPLNELGSMKVGFSFNGLFNTKIFENIDIADHTYTIRLHTVGTDKPYYDFKGAWGVRGDLGSAVQYFNTEEEAYVTAIQVFFVSDIPRNARVQDNFDDAGNKWSGRALYPIFYLYEYNVRTSAEAPALSVEATTEGYKINGLDADKLYAYSFNGGAWINVPANSENIKVVAEGTYSVKSLAYNNELESEASTVTIGGKQGEVDFAIEGNAITGLDASVVYEYAKVDYFGASEWVEVSNATEIADLDNALYAIRIKADATHFAGPIAYALVGNDSEKQASILKVDAAGVKSVDVNGSAPFNKGYWSSTNYGSKITLYESKTNRASVYWYHGAISKDTATALADLQSVDVTYVMKDDQILPLSKLGSMKFGLAFNGVIASKVYENYALTDNIYTVRFHTVGTDKPYYDFKGNWMGGNGVSQTVYFADLAEEDAYVTAIQVFFLTDVPEDAVVSQVSARDVYPILYLYEYNVRVPAETPTLEVNALDEGYAIGGLDADKLYAYSFNGGEWINVPAGSRSFTVYEEGTYSVKALASKNFSDSEPASITLYGKQPAVDCEITGNAITGLDASVVYEYAKVDYFGASEWVEVSNATEIADLDNALWAIRIKADENYFSGPISYALIGNDAAAQSTVLNVAADGKKTLNVDGTKSFNKGYWSTTNYTAIRFYESKTTFASILNNGFYTLPSDNANAFTKLAGVDVTYVMNDDQILPLSKLGSMTFSLAFNGVMSSKVFDNYPVTANGYTVRLHTVGADKAYYDFKGNWTGHGTAQTIYFADLVDEDAYVTAIQVFFITDVPADANVSTVSGRDLYPIFALYEYNVKVPAAAPVLTASAVTDGYIISGLDASKLYAYSTGDGNWINVEANAQSIKVASAGTYYVKSLEYQNFYESEAVAVAIKTMYDTVTGLEVEGNTITGLDASSVYEYAVINAYDAVWTTVENATEIADLEAGVYAVRLKEDSAHLASPAQYVIVKGENYGSIAMGKVTAFKYGFEAGTWTTGPTSYGKDYNLYLGYDKAQRIVVNWNTSYADRANLYYLYTMANDEVVKLENLIPLTVYTGFGAGSNLGTTEPITMRIRIYVKGADVEYYDCFVDYIASNWTTFRFDPKAHIPADATGFVTAIQFTPIHEMTDATHVATGQLAYPVFALGQYIVPGMESEANTSPDKFRVMIEATPAPQGLEVVIGDAANYANAYKVIGLNPEKLYEYADVTGTWTAVPEGSTEVALKSGTYYFRYAAVGSERASSEAEIIVPLTRPVFGPVNNSSYKGWTASNGAAFGTSEAYVTTYVNPTTPLKSIVYGYEFTEAEQFIVDEHPFFSFDFNTQMLGGLDINVGKYFPDCVIKINVYVKGEDTPYVITSTHKGFDRFNGYSANKIFVNLLEEFPAIAGKTVTKFEIVPFSNLEGNCNNYSKNGYAYFRIFYFGFFDTAVGTDSLAIAANNGKVVATFTGIEAEPTTILSVGSTVTAKDIAVYEIYSNGARYEIKNYTVTTPENFASEAGTYTVTVNSRLDSTCTVDVSVGLDHIELRTAPKKTEYFEGDKVDLSGIELVAVLTNGDEIIVATGYEATIEEVYVGMTSISVVYGGVEVSYDITVTPVELVSLAINTWPDKETKGGYTEGDPVDLTGLTVKATYNNGVVEIVGLDKIEAVYGADVMTRGTVLSISYNGKSIGGLILTVNSKPISEVTIATLPAKLIYFPGEELDLTGLSVNVFYEDGTTAVASTGFITETTLDEAGTITVAAYYEGFIVNFEVDVIIVETAFIIEFPAKTEYVIGEEFDAEGLTLYVLYSNGDEAMLTEGFELIYDEFTAEGEYEVVLKYRDYEEPFTVTVVAAEEPDPVVVESITVTAPTKTEYTVGDTLDLAGMVVTANYSDATTADVTALATVDTTTLATAGNVTVTVTYEGFTATFVVTVAEKVVEPEEPENIAEGTIEGTTVNWVITTDGTLTVSGEGEVPNYTRSATAPWYAYTKQIKKIVVADGITKLGDYCFYNLSKATAIEISTTVKFLGVQFIRQTAITEVTLTSDVTITANAFGRADNLKTLNLSEDVKNLQGNIFYQETVTIKAPENSFAHKYAEIYASKFASSAATVAYESDGTTAKLPIVRFAAAGDNAFFAIYENAKGNWALEVSGIGVMKNFPYVSAKNIAKGFTFSPMYYIGDEEAKIDGVEPEAKIASITVKEGITTVGNYIFYKCTKATTLTLPEGITSIGQGAFRLCQRIAKITLPEAVTKIEKNAFLSCGKLVEIYIPEGVTTVGEGIFEKCDSINSLVVKTKSAAAIEVISAEYPTVTIVTEF